VSLLRQIEPKKGHILHRMLRCQDCEHVFTVLRAMVGKTRCPKCARAVRIHVSEVKKDK
jgi:rRNA maturation endonuclease Nob1